MHCFDRNEDVEFPEMLVMMPKQELGRPALNLIRVADRVGGWNGGRWVLDKRLISHRSFGLLVFTFYRLGHL